jgi:pantothenate kinase
MPDTKVYLPEYSRTIHEPIAASVLVDPSVEVIIFEGNYLLLGDQPWNEIRSQFDVTVFCSTRWHVCRERLIERQMVSGKSLAGAVEWVDRVDRMNFDTVWQQSDTKDSLLYEEPDLLTLPSDDTLF